ncbi:hypothetical protein [Actinomadura flavalba]|uniref:hypothetical protein n=1 Tax=Actinomadura flavalba TaxID=1120938 RepID=UPI0003754805|nr:hypothetical protein [Actinomadura flavalba]
MRSAAAADPGVAPAHADPPIVTALRRAEADERTGVLHAGDEGAFFLDRGAVTYVTNRATTGLDRLVMSSGTVSAEEWGRVLLAVAERDGAPLREAGRAPGLGRARLEMFALLAAFDAASSLLGSAAEPRFEAGPPHWLAPVCRITPATLVLERTRRRDRLDAEWPDDRADTAPVVPVRRVRRQRVILTGLQAELLLNADGHRTAAGLALDLGRTTFGCLLAVRALAAARLIERPGPAVRPVAPALATAPAPGEPPAFWTPPDHDVLVRLRAALEELA